MSEFEPHSKTEAEQAHEHGVRFARRVYLLRTFGLAFGAVCIASVLWQKGAHPAAWIALAANGFLWPHVAYQIARRSSNPYRAELRNLTADSACGGAWVPLMDFNLLPSVLLVVMLSMDKVNVGGGKFLARCIAAQLVAGVASVLAFGFELRPESTMLNVVASLPLLVGYPMMVEFASHRLSWQAREQNRRLAALTRTDALSGLLNRRYWDIAVLDEFQRCRRIGYASTLLMLDVDGFKAINDRHGHQMGDQVIRDVAAVLRDLLRRQDIPGRYGGDEFVVVLPGTDSAGGQVVAERVRERVTSTVLERGPDFRATVSIGIAGLDAKDSHYGEWLEHADRALYEAKKQGRNRTVCYGI